VWWTRGQESDDEVLVSRKDLERLQQVVKTTNGLLPDIMNREMLTAFANVQSLEHGNVCPVSFVVG